VKRRLAGLATLVVAGFVGATFAALSPVPDRLPPAGADEHEPRYVDRRGELLSVTYDNRWNVHDRIPLHSIPSILTEAFVAAEDKRFYTHHGVDWTARLHAAWTNATSLRAVRGASTITEQVVRMIHPRPRTLWSRWVEGFDAMRLERRFEKAEILEFYLNQVPYARMRRGVQQAAREYFDRDLDTLTPKESLALAVLVRSPSRLDLKKGTEAIEKPVQTLAARLHAEGLLSELELERIETEPLRVETSELRIDAAHFVARVPPNGKDGKVSVATTLDGSLQRRAQQLLDRQIAALADQGVTDGAVLVVDHETDEILVWANGGGFTQAEGGQIDMVTVPRQPGSTLKPFLYALALERGWTAATVLVDEPIAEAVGNGLHSFRNYSRHYYGPIRLREALGNSLNVPAIKTVQFTGRVELYELLGKLGVTSLTEHPDYYGDGLALGNGELSLFELVSAYAVLARGGVRRPLKWKRDESRGREESRVLSAETSSLIADILSDPEARALEFGRSSVLNLPLQTAVKTGTSNDYRDAWTVGFTHRYTVGVWMGNLDRKPMHEVTGSIGPALVFRALLAELHRNREGKPLYLSRKLRQVAICRESGALPTDSCPRTTEWFRPDRAPESLCPLHSEKAATVAASGRVKIGRPSPGLHLALDPRIPDELERFALEVDGLPKGARVEWWIDDEPFAESTEEHGRSLWPLTRGRHVAKALVYRSETDEPTWTAPVGFRVK
jgi:penicillin-binding protein 1C